MKTMRRLILILLCACSMLTAQAQHLGFMGVELGNKLSVFDKELTRKGFMRSFSHKMGDVYKNGTFAGYDAEVLLYRQQPTKRVRSAAAKIIGDYDLAEAARILDDLRGKIAAKYPGSTATVITEGTAVTHLSVDIHNAYGERIELLIDQDEKVNVMYVGDLTKRDAQDDI